MKDLKKKNKYSNEDYVKHVNSIIDKNYEMFTEETTASIQDKTSGIIKEIPVTRNIIRHKSCGNVFQINRKYLLSKIKKELPLCPYCTAKKKK